MAQAKSVAMNAIPNVLVVSSTSNGLARSILSHVHLDGNPSGKTPAFC
ncbi:hypothetical protein OAH87_04490 [Marinomonas sp.]|nr:hypothetical protein [Marinomonas sp.]MDB4837708.1 hypothetical protein [Marinomonas sp.]